MWLWFSVVIQKCFCFQNEEVVSVHLDMMFIWTLFRSHHVVILSSLPYIQDSGLNVQQRAMRTSLNIQDPPGFWKEADIVHNTCILFNERQRGLVRRHWSRVPCCSLDFVLLFPLCSICFFFLATQETLNCHLLGCYIYITIITKVSNILLYLKLRVFSLWHFYITSWFILL